MSTEYAPTGIPYLTDSSVTHPGIARDFYPELKADIISVFRVPMRDPMDTPRPIGFRANHKNNEAT